MVDEVDITNDRIMADIEARIASARQAKEPGPQECEECEAPMSDLRRSLGLRVCVECAEIAEHRAKMLRRR